MHLLEKLRLILTHSTARLLYPNSTRLVIASTGRAGSTMLTNAVAASLIKHKLGIETHTHLNYLLSRSSKEIVGRLRHINKYSAYICKTHDLYDKLNNKVKCKYIFIHGDPLDSAISVEQIVTKKGIQWFSQHQHHLHGSGEYKYIFQKDILNYEGQLRSWMSHYDKDIYCVAYEDLWAQRSALSRFLGFELVLPKKRERSKKRQPPNVNSDLFERLRKARDAYSQQYIHLKAASLAEQ